MHGQGQRSFHRFSIFSEPVPARHWPYFGAEAWTIHPFYISITIRDWRFVGYRSASFFIPLSTLLSFLVQEAISISWSVGRVVGRSLCPQLIFRSEDPQPSISSHSTETLANGFEPNTSYLVATAPATIAPSLSEDVPTTAASEVASNVL